MIINTLADIKKHLGSLVSFCEYEELRRVRTRGGRIRSLVRVQVQRHLIEVFEDVTVPEALEQKEVTIWGTASANEPSETAKARAVSYGLMLFGLLPELAQAFGLDVVLRKLGPVGVDWGFEAIKTFQPTPDSVRCEVEVSCNQSRLSNDPARKEVRTRIDSGEVVVKTTCPEDEALLLALRNCALWMDFLPDDPDVAHDYNFEADYLAPPDRSAKPLSGSFVQKVLALRGFFAR